MKTKLFLTATILLSAFCLSFGQSSDSTYVVKADKDNSIFSELPNNSNGQGSLFVGRICNNNGLRRSLIHFDLSGLPTDQKVIDVQLIFAYNKKGSAAVDSNLTVFPLSQHFGEGASSSGTGKGSPAQAPDCTWTHAIKDTVTWNTPGGDYHTDLGVEGVFTAGKREIIFQDDSILIATVQSWIDESEENYGWMILGDEAVACSAYRLESRESNNFPTLLVTFAPGEDCSTLSDSIYVDGNQIIAVDTSASYQWLDCANNYAAIEGATTSQFSPEADGEYSLEISKENCIDTSACVSFVRTGASFLSDLGAKVSIYPNPTYDQVQIDFDQVVDYDIKIINSIGQIVRELKVDHDTSKTIELPSPSGIYWISIQDGDKSGIYKILKY